MCVYVYICVCVCVCIYIYIYIYVCVCVCVCICVCVCVCVYMDIYFYIYLFISGYHFSPLPLPPLLYLSQCDAEKRRSVSEPYVKLELFSPREYSGALLKLTHFHLLAFFVLAIALGWG